MGCVTCASSPTHTISLGHPQTFIDSRVLDQGISVWESPHRCSCDTLAHRLSLAESGLRSYGRVLKEVDMARLEIGSPAPDFTLKDCYDNTVSLSDLKGKKVALYFYTSSGGGN